MCGTRSQSRRQGAVQGLQSLGCEPGLQPTSVFMYIYTSLSLFLFLFLFSPLSFSLCLSDYVFLSCILSLSLSPLISPLCIHGYTGLSVYVHISYIYVSIGSIYLSIYLSIRLSFSSFFLSLSLSLSLCLQHPCSAKVLRIPRGGFEQEPRDSGVRPSTPKEPRLHQKPSPPGVCTTQPGRPGAGLSMWPLRIDHHCRPKIWRPRVAIVEHNHHSRWFLLYSTI